MKTAEPSGILLIDKPEGITSHDVVDFIRRQGGFRKVGHAGTLDPLARGLLVLLAGRSATREAGRFLRDEKAYEAILTFGFSTDTGDREGKPLQYGTYQHIHSEKIKETFLALQGIREQTVPIYSAVKKEGKKLYELARKGIVVEPPSRTIRIQTLEMRSFEPPNLSFFLVCSKGTYVRALVETIGENLGCPAHLAFLYRVRSGPFSVSEAFPFEEARKWDRETLVRKLRPLGGLTG